MTDHHVGYVRLCRHIFLKMSQIFDGEDSPDENTNFKTNNEYAKTYDVWRKKEELNKRKLTF